MRAAPLLDGTVLHRFALEGLWEPVTLWDRARQAPRDRTAVVCPRNGAVDYATLVGEAEGLAAAWHAAGTGPGDIVVLQLPNWYEFVLAHLALTRIGAVTLPLLPSYRERELRFVAGTAGAVALVGAPTFRTCPGTDLYDELVATVPGLRTSWAAEDLRDLARSGAGGPLPPPPSPDDVTIVMATSGTTGDPKLLLHSHRSTVGGVIDRVAAEMTLGPGDVMLMPSPISHATGLQYGVRMAIVLGTTLVLQDRWEPAAAARLVEAHGAAWIMGATPFLYDLVHLPDGDRARLAALRLFVCGGAPIPEPLARRAVEVLPGMSLLPAWGMSETGIATLVRPGDPLAKVTGTDGRPVPGWELRVTDADGRPVPPGTEGEIRCRGAAMFHGYLGRDDLTAEAVPDGWLRTGDLGRMDGDGYLRCMGRIKDLVIRGGLNISAAEVEDLVRLHPKVRDVAVVGAPDPRLGERVCAVVVPEAGAPPTVPELAEFLTAKGLAVQKLPEHVEAVDALPVSPTGKVQKYRLRERLAAYAPK